MNNRMLKIQSYPPDNSILVTGTDDQIREVKNAASFLDIQPKTVNLKAEAVIVLSDKAGHKHRAILSSNGKSTGRRPIHLQTVSMGDTTPHADTVLTNGLSDVR